MKKMVTNQQCESKIFTHVSSAFCVCYFTLAEFQQFSQMF